MNRPHRPHMPNLAERLTPRARAYLATAAAQHALIAFFACLHPNLFGSASFTGIKAALGGIQPQAAMQTWGGILACCAVLCVAAVVTGGEGTARAALLGSVLVEGLWLGGYIASASGQIIAPVGIIVWSGLIGRDLTMLRNPLRNPFEPIVRKLLAAEASTVRPDVPA